MASGFMQRFKGKIKAAQLWLDAGGLVDAKSGIAGDPLFVQKLTIQAVAALTEDYGPISAPPGMSLLRATFLTTVAFTGGSATLEIGVSAGDATYVTATDIHAIGRVALTINTDTALVLPAAPNLYPRITQTATTTAVGTGTLLLEYA